MFSLWSCLLLLPSLNFLFFMSFCHLLIFFPLSALQCQSVTCLLPFFTFTLSALFFSNFLLLRSLNTVSFFHVFSFFVSAFDDSHSITLIFNTKTVFLFHLNKAVFALTVCNPTFPTCLSVYLCNTMSSNTYIWKSEVNVMPLYWKPGFPLSHPPVDDSLSVQEKQTDSNLCSIKPAKLENRKDS